MDAAIGDLRVEAYDVPTDAPESDGTIAWDKTTVVVVHVPAGDQVGLGWTYAAPAATHLIAGKLADVIRGQDAFRTADLYAAMRASLRNLGAVGVGAMAVSAVDVALWDLRAKLLGASVVRLLGAGRETVPVYGSGGFTSYTVERLREQLGGWVASGIPRVKMKVGRHPAGDVARVRAAREAIGPDAELFVDANGAYSVQQSLAMAERFADLGVTWFEEPVPQQDHENLAFVRGRCPAGMDVSAGEYAWEERDVRRLLTAGAVDVMQADATRCGGYTGLLNAAAQCAAAAVPLSSHCGPALHAPVAAACPGLRHMEYFHDHVRIERMLFDGVPALEDGGLRLEPERPGHGMSLKTTDAERFLTWRSG